MPTYIIGGRRIRTEVPLSEADIEEIAASLGVTAAPQTAQKPEESPGFFQSIGKGTESLISSGRTALGTVFGSPEEAARAGIQRGEEISKRYGEGLSLDKLKEVYEKEGLLSAAGEVASAIPGAIGEQLPNIGAMAASARLGATAGSVFGPYGTAAGALLGMAAPSLVQQFGSNVERQAAEQQARGEAVNIDRARALEAAAPQAALDVVGEAIPLGGRLAGKLFGKEVQSLIFRGERAAADKLAKESLLTTIGKGTATGALAEVPTEVAQQALERWNAGLSLTDDDALKEYADTAFQVSLLAPIGAVGRVSERAAARSELAAGAPETPETPEAPEAPTTEEAPPAPKPVEVSPEALAAAKQYSDQIASGQAQFNLFKGRALIRKMGYQIGNDSKFAETKAIFDDLVSGKQVEMPKAGAPAAPAEPAEPVDISTLTSGQFVPREEMPRGTATPPVGEAVDTTTGRGAVMPPSGVGAAEPSVAGPQGAGVGPAVGAVETPDVREGTVQPALTETPAIEAAKPVEAPAIEAVKPAEALDMEPTAHVESDLREGDAVRVGGIPGTVIGLEGAYVKFRPVTAKSEKAFQRVPASMVTFESRPTDDLVSASKKIEEQFGEEAGKLDVDKEAMLQLLGENMYGANVADVAVKEMLQNSFDAVKESVKKGQYDSGNIDISLDPEDRTMTIEDNGVGMTPDIVRKAFFTIGGSAKDLDPTEISGGFGLAKMGVLMGAKRIDLETVRDGIKTTVSTSRNDIAKDNFKIVKTTAPKDAHGTKVTLTIPETYIDKKGEVQSVWFPSTAGGLSILNKALVGPAKVTFKNTRWNDESSELSLGTGFDLEKTPKLTTAETDWGYIDVYMGVERKKKPDHQILSSGIWQFNHRFSLNQNELIPYDLVVNIRSKVPAKDIDYPFTNSREAFKPRVKEDIEALQAFIRQVARGEEAKGLQQSFKDIVQMPRVEAGEDLKEASNKLRKVFDKRREETAGLRAVVPDMPKTIFIDNGGVTDKIGRTIIEPVKTSDVTKKATFEANKAAPTADEFKIVLEQDPKLPLFHNNTNVDYVEIGDKYGDPRKFFAELGTIVVEMKEALGNSGLFGWPRSYDVLKPENMFFAGISIDKDYGGVHLKSIPYKAIYLNPFYEWGAESLFGIRSNIYETITHELAHTGDMDHGVAHNTEMVKVRQYLADEGLEDYFRDAILKTLVNHESAFTAMKEAYGRSTTKNNAKSLEEYNKDTSSASARGSKTGAKGTPRAVPAGGGQGGRGAIPPAGASGAAGPVGRGAGKPAPVGPVDNKNRTPEQAIKARQDTYKERFTKKSLSERILKYLWGKDAGGHLLDKYEALVKKFQNDLRPALTLEQALKRAGELITYGPGMNDAFSKIASAQDKAAWLTSNMLKVPMDKAYKAIEKFARSRNLTTDQAIEELDRYRIVLHEPERRMIMFMRYVPLSTKRRAFKDSTGKTIQISPAEIRDSILRSLVKPGNDLVANGQAKQLHDVLKALVSDKANLDPLGDSPIKKEGKPLSIDINDDQYSVLAGYSPEFIAKWKQTFDALGTQKPTAEAAIKAIEDVQEVTKELNRQANYWTKPVDNIVAFYNFEHYTPFKGVPGTKVRASAEMTDPNDVRISGEFADADQAMEGRESEADNSVLQSFSDAMYAASRAGRAGVTEAVKNLIEQGHVSGRKIAEITHEQRWLDKDFNLRQYKGKNKLFHYTPDGNIEVYQIANKDLGFLEAIRRPYQVENWTTKMANNLTGFMGQMHTRFSPSFAPLNFPRDVFTNTMSISADIGGKEALNYLSDALFRNVMKGGLFKSGKVSKLISENRIGELRALAKKDPFYADVIELMEEGGRTAYQQAYNIQAQASELEKRLGPDGIVKMGREGAETLGKWADMYNDAFEFTNRVSAYGIMKSNSMAKLKQRFREKNRREPNAQELAQINKAARSEAASFTKNLANFRLIGTAGRQAGGLFMFFRASATGAVRAIDSLLPAFVDEKTALSKAPASIRDNPESAKRFLKDYRENKKRAQYTMYATAAAGAFLYGLALAGADDDDQGRNKVATDDMARWTRYARLPILGKDTVLQIPWGFGMASFGAIGAQVAALASGNQPAKDAAANIINIATDSFIPLPKSNINVFDNFFGFLVDSATPTLVRPVVEFAMNTDSLGNEIYNSRQSKLSDAFTGGTNVPELYRDVARGLLESTGLSISPNTLYFWMANYADALSRVATSTYDLRLFATGQREFRGVDDLDKVLIPFDSFIGTKSNYDGRQYENVKNQIEDKQKILKSLEQRPEAYVKYVEKHPMDPDLVDYYNKTVNGELKDLQEAANVVRVSDQLTPQQRRDILKENVRMQNMLKRGLIDSFKYYGLKPTN